MTSSLKYPYRTEDMPCAVWFALLPSDRWLQRNGGVAIDMAKANSVKPSTVPLGPLQPYIK
jgi:hypothetical protein